MVFVILRLYESESVGCISAGLWHCYSVVGGYLTCQKIIIAIFRVTGSSKM